MVEKLTTKSHKQVRVAGELDWVTPPRPNHDDPLMNYSKSICQRNARNTQVRDFYYRTLRRLKLDLVDSSLLKNAPQLTIQQAMVVYRQLVSSASRLCAFQPDLIIA